MEQMQRHICPLQFKPKSCRMDLSRRGFQNPEPENGKLFLSQLARVFSRNQNFVLDTQLTPNWDLQARIMF
jgi:hypothetical protein